MDALRWEPMDLRWPDILCLRHGSDELARVQERVGGDGWVSWVAQHRDIGRRRLWCVAPSRRTAIRWAERWTRIRLAVLLGELGTLHETHCGTRSRVASGPPGQSGDRDAAAVAAGVTAVERSR